MYVFVISYADSIALPGLYASEAALVMTLDPEDQGEDIDARLAAAREAKAHPGEPVDLGDGDVLIWQGVTE